MGFTSGGIRDDDGDNGVDDVFVQPIANNTSKVIDATDRGVSDGGGSCGIVVSCIYLLSYDL